MPGMPPLPDFSKPPPGFPRPGGPHIPPPDIDLTPSVPYYELPAGLIAPLIKVKEVLLYDIINFSANIFLFPTDTYIYNKQ